MYKRQDNEEDASGERRREEKGSGEGSIKARYKHTTTQNTDYYFYYYYYYWNDYDFFYYYCSYSAVALTDPTPYGFTDCGSRRVISLKSSKVSFSPQTYYKA